MPLAAPAHTGPPQPPLTCPPPPPHPPPPHPHPPPLQPNPDYSWYPHTASRHGDEFVGYPAYVKRYKLPEGFSCEHCILQWYWMSAHQ